MTKRKKVLGFSIRSAGVGSVAATRAAVEQALACHFEPTTHGGIPMWSTNLLGMRVLFALGSTPDPREAFELHGIVYDLRFEKQDDEAVELEEIDISVAVADLLELNGAGQWWVASQSEAATNPIDKDEV
jgi:hypothetical protein